MNGDRIRPHDDRFWVSSWRSGREPRVRAIVSAGEAADANVNCSLQDGVDPSTDSGPARRRVDQVVERRADGPHARYRDHRADAQARSSDEWRQVAMLQPPGILGTAAGHGCRGLVVPYADQRIPPRGTPMASISRERTRPRWIGGARQRNAPTLVMIFRPELLAAGSVRRSDFQRLA
jgi:hypothetical protein